MRHFRINIRWHIYFEWFARETGVRSESDQHYFC